MKPGDKIELPPRTPWFRPITGKDVYDAIAEQQRARHPYEDWDEDREDVSEVGIDGRIDCNRIAEFLRSRNVQSAGG